MMYRCPSVDTSSAEERLRCPVSAERVEQLPPPARVPDDTPTGTDREPPQHDPRIPAATGFHVRGRVGGSH
jgi:hypothetical protein